MLVENPCFVVPEKAAAVPPMYCQGSDFARRIPRGTEAFLPYAQYPPCSSLRYPERGSTNDAGAHPSLLRLVFHSLHSRDLFLLLQAKFVLYK